MFYKGAQRLLAAVILLALVCPNTYPQLAKIREAAKKAAPPKPTPPPAPKVAPKIAAPTPAVTPAEKAAELVTEAKEAITTPQQPIIKKEDEEKKLAELAQKAAEAAKEAEAAATAKKLQLEEALAKAKALLEKLKKEGLTVDLGFPETKGDEPITPDTSLKKRALKKVKENELESVTTLYLEENALTSIHNNAFKDFPNLLTLVLYHCSIEIVEPKAFEDLKHLQLLDLSYNDIEKLPLGLFEGLDDLETVVYGQNPIADPTNLAGAKNIDDLKKRYPKIDFIRTSPKILKLHHDRAYARAAAKIIYEGGLFSGDIRQRLKHMVRGEAGYKITMQNQMALLDWARSLAKKCCERGWVVLANKLGSFTPIDQNVLNLANEDLKKISDITERAKELNYDPKDFKYVTVVMLAGNKFETIANDELGKLFPNAHCIDLSNNRIEKIEDRAFSNMPYLQYLFLADNFKLASFSPDIVKNTPELIMLSIGKTPLSLKDAEIKKIMDAKRNLYIARSPLTKKSIINMLIVGGMAALVYLGIIIGGAGGLLAFVTGGLVVENIWQEAFMQASFDLFGQPWVMQKLSDGMEKLMDERKKSQGGIFRGGLERRGKKVLLVTRSSVTKKLGVSLKTLDLSNQLITDVNQIKDKAKEFGYNTKTFKDITAINLSRNNITKIPDNAFKDFPNIEVIDLSGNLIGMDEVVTTEAEQKTPKIVTAQKGRSLADTLKEIKKASEVEVVAGQKIVRSGKPGIAKKAFANLTKLKTLVLTDNQIKSFPTSSVEKCPLKVIYLGLNPISAGYNLDKRYRDDEKLKRDQTARIGSQLVFKAYSDEIQRVKEENKKKREEEEKKKLEELKKAYTCPEPAPTTDDEKKQAAQDEQEAVASANAADAVDNDTAKMQGEDEFAEDETGWTDEEWETFLKELGLLSPATAEEKLDTPYDEAGTLPKQETRKDWLAVDVLIIKDYAKVVEKLKEYVQEKSKGRVITVGMDQQKLVGAAKLYGLVTVVIPGILVAAKLGMADDAAKLPVEPTDAAEAAAKETAEQAAKKVAASGNVDLILKNFSPDELNKLTPDDRLMFVKVLDDYLSPDAHTVASGYPRDASNELQIVYLKGMADKARDQQEDILAKAARELAGEPTPTPAPKPTPEPTQPTTTRKKVRLKEEPEVQPIEPRAPTPEPTAPPAPPTTPKPPRTKLTTQELQDLDAAGIKKLDLANLADDELRAIDFYKLKPSDLVTTMEELSPEQLTTVAHTLLKQDPKNISGWDDLLKTKRDDIIDILANKDLTTNQQLTKIKALAPQQVEPIVAPRKMGDWEVRPTRADLGYGGKPWSDLTDQEWADLRTKIDFEINEDDWRLLLSKEKHSVAVKELDDASISKIINERKKAIEIASVEHFYLLKPEQIKMLNPAEFADKPDDLIKQLRPLKPEQWDALQREQLERIATVLVKDQTILDDLDITLGAKNIDELYTKLTQPDVVLTKEQKTLLSALRAHEAKSKVTITVKPTDEGPSYFATWESELVEVTPDEAARLAKMTPAEQQAFVTQKLALEKAAAAKLDVQALTLEQIAKLDTSKLTPDQLEQIAVREESLLRAELDKPRLPSVEQPAAPKRQLSPLERDVYKNDDVARLYEEQSRLYGLRKEIDRLQGQGKTKEADELMTLWRQRQTELRLEASKIVKADPTQQAILNKLGLLQKTLHEMTPTQIAAMGDEQLRALLQTMSPDDFQKLGRTKNDALVNAMLSNNEKNAYRGLTRPGDRLDYLKLNSPDRVTYAKLSKPEDLWLRGTYVNSKPNVRTYMNTLSHDDLIKFANLPESARTAIPDLKGANTRETIDRLGDYMVRAKNKGEPSLYDQWNKTFKRDLMRKGATPEQAENPFALLSDFSGKTVTKDSTPDELAIAWKTLSEKIAREKINLDLPQNQLLREIEVTFKTPEGRANWLAYAQGPDAVNKLQISDAELEYLLRQHQKLAQTLAEEITKPIPPTRPAFYQPKELAYDDAVRLGLKTENDWITVKSSWDSLLEAKKRSFRTQLQDIGLSQDWDKLTAAQKADALKILQAQDDVAFDKFLAKAATKKLEVPTAPPPTPEAPKPGLKAPTATDEDLGLISISRTDWEQGVWDPIERTKAFQAIEYKKALKNVVDTNSYDDIKNLLRRNGVSEMDIDSGFKIIDKNLQITSGTSLPEWRALPQSQKDAFWASLTPDKKTNIFKENSLWWRLPKEEPTFAKPIPSAPPPVSELPPTLKPKPIPPEPAPTPTPPTTKPGGFPIIPHPIPIPERREPGLVPTVPPPPPPPLAPEPEPPTKGPEPEPTPAPVREPGERKRGYAETVGTR